MLSEDFREFVALLNAHKVEYLIVGGYAVGIHGHPGDEVHKATTKIKPS